MADPPTYDAGSAISTEPLGEERLVPSASATLNSLASNNDFLGSNHEVSETGSLQLAEESEARYETLSSNHVQDTPTQDARPSAAASSGPAGVGDILQRMMENLSLRVGNEFPPLIDPQGDTLIYIGTPARLHHHDNDEHTHIQQHFHRFHQVHSSRLKALDSKKFGGGEGQLLGPGACMRARKRLMKLDIYQKIPEEELSRIKYHIDMRPPSEDDEAVLLLTTLSCTSGIRNWWRAKNKYNLPSNLVAGTDELDTPSNPYHTPPHPPVTDTKQAQDPDESRPEPMQATTLDLTVTELCPLRQHSAVERMLNAICGNDPRIDSAAKLWALFATANFYDCARHSSVSHPIESWLYSDKNAHFIQNNPELAYQIGIGCQISRLAKDAFSILVGEKALIDIQNELSGRPLSLKLTVHGRELANLDDDERNRIDHAASSLARRVPGHCRSIAIDMDWVNDCPEFIKLSNFEVRNPGERRDLQHAISLLRDYCVSRIEATFLRNLRFPFNDLDASALTASDFRNGKPPTFDLTYNHLKVKARPFTRSFWMSLQSINFSAGTWSNTVDADELDSPTPQLQPRNAMSKTHLTDAFSTLNTTLAARTLKCAASDTGPDVLDGSVYRAPSNENHKAATEDFWYDPWQEKSHQSQQTSGLHVSEVSSPVRKHSLITSPRIGNDLVVDPNPISPGKRRKTLEHADVNKEPLTVPAGIFTDVATSTALPIRNRLFRRDSNLLSQMTSDPTKSTSGLGDDPPMSQQGHAGPSKAYFRPGADQSVANPAAASSSGYVESGYNHFDENSAWPLPAPRKSKILQQFSDTGPPPPEVGLRREARDQRNCPCFSADDLLSGLSRVLASKCGEIIYPPHLFHSAEPTPINLVDTLVCLDDEEWKYLPLWAGGFDDGKGGVFDEADVPNNDAAGFRGGKRGLGRYSGTATEGSMYGSDSSGFEDIASEAISTVGRASKDATDGTATVRSINESDTRSDDGFMSQNDVYAVVQEMNMERRAKKDGPRSGATSWMPAEDFDFDGNEEEDDISTIMGTTSDVQGDFFGGDEEENEFDDSTEAAGEDDMEVIEKDTL